MTYLDCKVGTKFVEEIDGIDYEITTTPTIVDEHVKFIAKRLDSEERREFAMPLDTELILA